MSNDSAINPLLVHTVQIVSAHLGHNNVPANGIPALIQHVFAALNGLESSELSQRPRQEPAVPIKQSVFPNYIICLEDGRRLKMLKRHLRTSYNMTVDEYRTKWDLPPSYPTTAPNYAEHRSKLAKKIGLGRQSIAAKSQVDGSL